MKHADVFGSLYIMSPCCLSARGVGRDPAELEKTLAAATSPADTAKLPFFARAISCGVGLVAQSEESAVLSRSGDEGRHTPSGGAGALGRKCSPGVR
jgi:hypothetical protein